MIYIGDTPPEITNQVPWVEGTTIEQRREGTRQRQQAWRKAVRDANRKLDATFAGMSRPSPRHRHPGTRQQAPRTGSQGFRDALQGAAQAQALRGARPIPAKAFGEDFALMFDAAIETAVIDRQTKEFNQ